MLFYLYTILFFFSALLYGIGSLLAHRTFKYLNSVFKVDPLLKVYQETKTLFHFPKNCKRCLLIITGFANTPLGLKKITDFIDSDCGYYVPRNVGWGRSDFREAHHIEWQDWVLRYQEAYILLKTICPRVDIIAHSAGSNIAAFLVSKFKVEKLYLIAPNLTHHKRHKYKKMLILFPWIGKFLCYLFPLFPFGPDENQPKAYLKTGYYYLSVPTNAVREMWKMQNACIHIDKWNVNSETWIIMDPDDIVVGCMEEQINILSKRVLNLNIQILENAGHNVTTMPGKCINNIINIINK